MAITTTTTTTVTTNLTPTKLQQYHHPIFPLSDLPYELRQLIYASYLSLLPPFHITPTTLGRLPHPALLRSSPLFLCDIAPSLFYQHATFAFTSVADLVGFGNPAHSHHVRNIRILSHQDRKGGDWVYCAQRCFPCLEDIVFEFAEDEELQFNLDDWWERVLDALREGREAARSGLRVSIEKGGGNCLTKLLRGR